MKFTLLKDGAGQLLARVLFSSHHIFICLCGIYIVERVVVLISGAMPTEIDHKIAYFIKNRTRDLGLSTKIITICLGKYENVLIIETPIIAGYSIYRIRPNKRTCSNNRTPPPIFLFYFFIFLEILSSL